MVTALDAGMRFQDFKHNPHQILGLHRVDDETKVIRLWRPGATSVHLEVFGAIVEAKKTDLEGFFEYIVPAHTTHLDYEVYHQNGLHAYDPYAFWPTVGELDAHLFAKGAHYKLYEVLGAKIVMHQGAAGTKFAVWAPSALEVALVGDFNYWNGQVNPMRSMGASGIWELFVPGIEVGEKYKFEIRMHNGQLKVKSDPFAFECELRPKNCVDSFRYRPLSVGRSGVVRSPNKRASSA